MRKYGEAMKLYIYCLRHDDGAAPNPYGGVCTLAICKPAIRRTAEEGDWVVGHGRTDRNGPDLSKSIVYAMKVTSKMTLEEYDELCQDMYPLKIPDWDSGVFERMVGDCIYDYSGRSPRLRKGVHSRANRERDLSGKNVLLSNHFYYFGERAIAVPKHLHELLHPNQGHKVKKNDHLREPFVQWIESLGHQPNILHGEPLMKIAVLTNPAACDVCSREHLASDDGDEQASCE